MLVPTSPPLLVADQVSLRSRRRQRLTGMYRWKPRRVVVSRQSDAELLLQLYPNPTSRTTEPSLQLIIDTTVHTFLDDDHSTHMIVMGSPESQYTGTDLPKDDHDDAISRSWRIRFSSNSQALVLDGYSPNKKPSRPNKYPSTPSKDQKRERVTNRLAGKTPRRDILSGNFNLRDFSFCTSGHARDSALATISPLPRCNTILR